MRKIVRVFGVLIVLLILAGAALFVIGSLQKRGAGIMVDTTPAANVYIDGEQVGRTPYEAVIDPGEITLKLIPDSFDKPLAPFETKLLLVSDVQTVVKRNFAETEDLASGVIISFEKVGGGEQSLSAISIPDSAQVALDSQVRGFTPFKSTSITKGEHTLALSANGYTESSISVRVISGYKLTAVFKLAPSGEVSADANVETALPSPTPEPVVEETKKVLVLDTGTGFLRVRSASGTSGIEVGQVTPGKEYTYLDKDSVSGWYKIEYETGKEGWISGQYAKMVDSKPSPSPTASATPSPGSF